jgi:hypothetical protein
MPICRRAERAIYAIDAERHSPPHAAVITLRRR